MTPPVLPILAALVTVGLMTAAAAPKASKSSCETARALAEVKLASEIERADAQVYLVRLELATTKRQLVAAVAKCGAACAPTAP
ncbi:hypothetical protein [Phenylobacterium sp.]|uniref:hypothetical protein n=1 Tax=Phenylobacterium sp. TaxID=1871053 RepID=UPI003983468B